MLGIDINRENEVSLKRQIYQKIKDYIIDGRISAGEPLPSTRELAKGLAVSRNTVCEAYDMLMAEGFVLSSQGAPTRVAEGLSIPKESSEESLQKESQSNDNIKADFRTGQPDLRYFPRYIWNRIMYKAMDEMPLCQFGYSGPDGIMQLREEISGWLFRSRGIKADPCDIFITSGATHGLHLISGMLYEEGKGILIEDPCHMGMLRALRNKGHLVYPVPVDEHGIMVEHLDGKAAWAVYVTPSHQFPLGGILPAGRRAGLIRFARENGIYIIEDDYDSEFRYCGEPIAPLYSMDPQRVIYVGTFSKVLFPALRIGYVLLPRHLHKKWRYLRTHTDVQNPPFEQAALAEFLKSRKIDRHVLKMKRLYGERRKALLLALGEQSRNTWHSWGDATGLHLAVEFPGMQFGDEFMDKCKANGIILKSVDYHSICKGRHLDKLLLGYGHMDIDEIYKGISVLNKLIASM